MTTKKKLIIEVEFPNNDNLDLVKEHLKNALLLDYYVQLSEVEILEIHEEN